MINKEILIVKSSEPYNKEFVKNILESKNQIKTGKITKIKKENLKLFLGL